MGCCLSRDGSLSDSDELDGHLAIGKSRPLLQERLKWRSDIPITEGQLRSKRDEFWETAPCFDGRREIWDALRAASTQAENGDWAMAQAILEGANVVLPDGTLRESYDELGNRYQVPIYCLFHPINLIEQHSDSSNSSNHANQNNVDFNPDPPPGGKSMEVKFRLSETGSDIKMEVKSTETVSSVKKRLAFKHNLSQDTHDQRWYFGGRYLSDKLTMQQCNIPDHFVIQVIVRSPEDCPVVVTSAVHGAGGRKSRSSAGKRKKKRRDKPSREGGGGGQREASGTLSVNSVVNNSNPAAHAVPLNATSTSTDRTLNDIPLLTRENNNVTEPTAAQQSSEDFQISIADCSIHNVLEAVDAPGVPLHMEVNDVRGSTTTNATTLSDSRDSSGRNSTVKSSGTGSGSKSGKSAEHRRHHRERKVKHVSTVITRTEEHALETSASAPPPIQ